MLLEELKNKFLDDMELKNKSEQTITGYEKDIRTFQRFLERSFNGPVYIEEIKEQDFEDYIRYLRNERGLQPRSQNRYFSAIRSMYNYAFKKRIIKENIAQYVENVQYERKEREHLTVRELEMVFERINHPTIKIAVMTLAYSGLRISELCNLTLQDVDMINRIMKVNGKGNKQRFVPISNTLHEILEAYLKTHISSTEMFFALEKTGTISPAYVNKYIREAAKAAGIKKQVSAHTMRHSFASYLIKQKVDIATLQRLLGHANVRTTSVYLHTDVEQLEKAVNVW